MSPEPSAGRKTAGSCIKAERRLTYGQLAKKAAYMPVPGDIPLKDPSSFTIVGTPTSRLDSPEKVDGRAIFGLDARHPGDADRRHRAVPRLRRQGESLDAGRP